MGAGHSHGHEHAGGRHRWRLAVSFALIATFFVVELVTALVSGSLALLSALRCLARDQRLLVAVDDVQWLDRSSQAALAYAARRLQDGVGVLLARRPGPPSAVERSLGVERVDRLVVRTTTLGGTRQILASRLGLRLPHHLLRRVYDTTLGNPLFALEVGRLLSGRDPTTLAASTTTVTGRSAVRSPGQLAPNPGCSSRRPTLSAGTHSTAVLSGLVGVAVVVRPVAATTVR